MIIGIGNYNISLARKKQKWYSVSSGSWDDPSVWVSNGKRKGKYPKSGDDVYINLGHTIISPNFDVTVNNLYIAQQAEIRWLAGANNKILWIKGDVCCDGTIDMSTTANINSLVLFGFNNRIANYIAGINSTVYYNGNGDQTILNLPYRHLTIGSQNTQNANYLGTKTFEQDIIIAGNLTVAHGTVDFKDKSVTVLGNTTIGGVATLKKSTNIGTTIFTGLFTYGNVANLDFSGNPDVEFRGGFSAVQNRSTFNTGTGTWKFSTNDQDIYISYLYVGYNFNCHILISGDIEVGVTGTGYLIELNGVNGDHANSRFTIKGGFMQTSASLPMQTGIYTYNGVGYHTHGFQVGQAEYTIPFTTFENLIIGNGGTKLLSGSTVVNQNLTIQTGNALHGLDLSDKSFEVKGQTIFQFGFLKKTTNIGTTIFGGLVNVTNNQALDFSGNPDVEFRGGLQLGQYPTFNSGTGKFKFTTNNQNLSCGTNPGMNAIVIAFDCDIEIGDGIELSLVGLDQIVFNKPINGIGSGSKLINKVTPYTGGLPVAILGYVTYRVVQAPMQTGLIDFSTYLNSWEYGLNGNQDVRSGTYRNLKLYVGGVKKLLGNVSVQDTYSLVAPATLDANGFTLTNP